MSTEKTIYLALQEQLKKVEGLKWIDRNMGQIQMLDGTEGDLVPMPGILIQFGRNEKSNVGRNVQKGAATFIFSILYENIARSHSGSSDQDIALRYFDFIESVHLVLQGFEGDNFTPLMQSATEEDPEHRGFVVNVLEYRTTITYRETDKQKNLVTTAVIEPVPSYENPGSRPAKEVKTGFVIHE